MRCTQKPSPVGCLRSLPSRALQGIHAVLAVLLSESVQQNLPPRAMIRGALPSAQISPRQPSPLVFRPPTCSAVRPDRQRRRPHQVPPGHGLGKLDRHAGAGLVAEAFSLSPVHNESAPVPGSRRCTRWCHFRRVLVGSVEASTRPRCQDRHSAAAEAPCGRRFFWSEELPGLLMKQATMHGRFMVIEGE